MKSLKLVDDFNMTESPEDLLGGLVIIPSSFVFSPQNVKLHFSWVIDLQ
jgi:hypothetical protein